LPFPEVKQEPYKPITNEEIPIGHPEKTNNFWENLKNIASKALNNPDLLASTRLAGQLITNNSIYDEALKGIRPDLK
jgi:hypothetical protein